ncbi:hypothetical protein DUNSADRAFT_10931 [Dunaliella salina]|uniref:Uncharacterized protein n=1 Tax=Dunaliella salina TaxID=3046 RepID=A0ABQ7GEH6_DUNSA|nr:hypothetical protein DUNSADRAFT_10931 [Dunaliella salina]|eukprot:KAF5833010.1 hypothetical protein DUNSADRAFT_10931 [Dunaliella salina]
MAKECNVAELQLKGGITPLPPTLPAAVAAATDSKAGSSMLQISLGLHLPGGGPSIVLPNGVLSSGSDLEGAAGSASQASPTTTSTHAPPCTFAPNLLVFEPPRCRVLLSSADVQALVHMLEDGGQLQCEVARFLNSDSLSDPAWPAFRGVAAVPRSRDLIMPGVTEVQQERQEACPLKAVPASGFASALPNYVPPQGKGVKVLEEGLPPLAPGSPLPCAWAEAGSRLQGLSLRFARPLVPAWKPPPSRPLMELLPGASNHLQRHIPSKAAVQAFKDQVKQMAAALVDLQLSGEGGANNGQQQTAPGLRQLKEHLADSGKLAELREGLRRSSVAVAMEQHRRGIGGAQLTEQQQASLLVDLHTNLESAMHEALGLGSHQESAPGQQQGGPLKQQQLQKEEGGEGGKEGWQAQLAQLQQLAQDCEVTGAHRRAEALYQRMVTIATGSNAASKAHQPDFNKPGHEAAQGVEATGRGVQGATPCTAGHADGSTAAEPSCAEAQQAMYAYATFCLRWGHGRHGRAEQLLRRALGLPPTRCSSAWPAANGGGSDGGKGEGNGHDDVQGAPTEASVGGGGTASFHGWPQPGMQHHVPSLLALALLLLHHGRVTDGMLLEEAAELARQLVATVRGSSQEPLAWAVLYMTCQASGDAARAEDIAASLAGLQRAEAEGLVPVETHNPTSPAGPSGPEPPAAGAELQGGGGLPEPPAAGAKLQGSGGAEGSGDGSPAPPQLNSSGQQSPLDRLARTSSQASRQARATGVEGAASEGGGMAEPTQPSHEDTPLCLAPGATPSHVNGMLALASLCATELALPALALAAWQQGAAELQASLSVPQVSAEMELAGALAYRWIYCWEKEVAAQADSRFGVGEEDADGAAAWGVPVGGSEWERAQAEEFGDQGLSRMGSQGTTSMQKHTSSASGQGDPGLWGGEALTKATAASVLEPVSEGGMNSMGVEMGANHHNAQPAATHSHQGQEAGESNTMGGNSTPQREHGGADAARGGSRESQREHKQANATRGGSRGSQREHGGADATRGGSRESQREHGGIDATRGGSRESQREQGGANASRSGSRGSQRERKGLGSNASRKEAEGGPGKGQVEAESGGQSNKTEQEGDAHVVQRAHARAAEVLEAALGLCAAAGVVLGEGEVRPRLLAGELLFLAGRWPEAATRAPCASVWLQAGRTHAQLGQHAASEAALAEAVGLDAESPHVWAALALAAMSGNPSQAAASGCAALACALRLGLEDVGLLRELSRACNAAGLEAEARSCLEAAVALAPKRGALAVEARLQLAQALVRACEFGPGRMCYESALAISTSQRQQQSVKRHLLATRLLSR